MEALAAGCPVVAVHATGSDDVVRNGVNGFLTAEDEDAWAEKAAEALRPENLGRMREAARSDADNYRASRLAIYAEIALQSVCTAERGRTDMNVRKTGAAMLQRLFAKYLDLLRRTVAVRWDDGNRYGDSQIYGFWHEDSFFMNLVLERLATGRRRWM